RHTRSKRNWSSDVCSSDLFVGASPSGLAVADVNGDGKPDMVVADGGNATVSVLLGYGNGSFQPSLNYSVGDGTPTAVLVPDVNKIGRASCREGVWRWVLVR